MQTYFFDEAYKTQMRSIFSDISGEPVTGLLLIVDLIVIIFSRMAVPGIPLHLTRSQSSPII